MLVKSGLTCGGRCCTLKDYDRAAIISESCELKTVNSMSRECMQVLSLALKEKRETVSWYCEVRVLKNGRSV